MRILSAFRSEKQSVKDLSLFSNVFVSKVKNTSGLRTFVDSFLSILCRNHLHSASCLMSEYIITIL